MWICFDCYVQPARDGLQPTSDSFDIYIYICSRLQASCLVCLPSKLQFVPVKYQSWLAPAEGELMLQQRPTLRM